MLGASLRFAVACAPSLTRGNTAAPLHLWPCSNPSRPLMGPFSAVWCSVRLASAAKSPSAATKQKKAKESKKKASARGTPPASVAAASSPSTSAANIASAPAVAKPRQNSILAKIEEHDVRLAIRMIMTNHIARNNHAKSANQRELDKERMEYQDAYEARAQRLLEKDKNSMQLLGEDTGSLGAGIVPIIARTAQNPYDGTSDRAAGNVRGGSGSAVWRTLNPVGLAASQAVASMSISAAAGDGDALSEDAYEAFLAQSQLHQKNGGPLMEDGDVADVETDEEWKAATLTTLCVPDLSVYDTDHDFRISSEDALRQSQGELRRGTKKGNAKGGTADAVAAAASVHGNDDALTLEVADLSLIGAAELEESAAAMNDDPDYAVSHYTQDEDEGPLQL